MPCDQVVAVDVGTSMIKALRLASDGTVLARAALPAPADRAPGVDAMGQWEAVRQVLAEVAAGAPPALAGVVVTGQGDGLWRIDRDGQPQRAYLWNATEPAEVVGSWEADGTIERHFRATGTVLWPGTSAALWRWLVGTDPDALRDTASVGTAKDWISYQLTGVHATDVTDGTIPFLDLATGTHDPALVHALGCDGLADLLPPVRTPGEILAPLTSTAAEATGLPAGTPVIVGCLDLAAMVRGLGLSAPGDALAVLGTTATTVAISDHAPLDREPAGATVRLPGSDRFLRIMGAMSGTTTLEWFLDLHSYDGEDRYDRFWDDIAGVDQGIVLLPYLAGERAPFLAPDATGAILGLTRHSTCAGIGRATVEGITFSLRHGLEAVGAGDDALVLTGGGSSRPEWCQLVADVTGRAVLVDERGDVGVLGAASLVPGFEALAHRGVDARRYEPGPASEELDQRYRRFVSLVEAFRPLWKELLPR
ncbi:MAG: FGGY family carbohydrate kinase [Nitriliruptoraceae bacterium]